MAEVIAVIGVVASVASIAAEGVKVSNSLNTYIDSIKYAEEDLRYIASEIKDTTVVLSQLEDNLRLEQQSTGVFSLFCEFLFTLSRSPTS